MSLTQNEKIRQVTEGTIIIGVDIASAVNGSLKMYKKGEAKMYRPKISGHAQKGLCSKKLNFKRRGVVPAAPLQFSVGYVRCCRTKCNLQ